MGAISTILKRKLFFGGGGDKVNWCFVLCHMTNRFTTRRLVGWFHHLLITMVYKIDRKGDNKRSRTSTFAPREREKERERKNKELHCIWIQLTNQQVGIMQQFHSLQWDCYKYVVYTICYPSDNFTMTCT